MLCNGITTSNNNDQQVKNKGLKKTDFSEKSVYEQKFKQEQLQVMKQHN
jgi:hypothetical protein